MKTKTQLVPHPTTTALLTNIHIWLENEEPTIDLQALADPWIKAEWPDMHQDGAKAEVHELTRHLLHEIWTWVCSHDHSGLDLIAMAEEWRDAGCPGSNHKSKEA